MRSSIKLSIGSSRKPRSISNKGLKSWIRKRKNSKRKKSLSRRRLKRNQQISSILRLKRRQQQRISLINGQLKTTQISQTSTMSCRRKNSQSNINFSWISSRNAPFFTCKESKASSQLPTQVPVKQSSQNMAQLLLSSTSEKLSTLLLSRHFLIKSIVNSRRYSIRLVL